MATRLSSGLTASIRSLRLRFPTLRLDNLASYPSNGKQVPYGSIGQADGSSGQASGSSEEAS